MVGRGLRVWMVCMVRMVGMVERGDG